MPVKFRCAYCTQLMSIASRKIGAIVKCPKCRGEVMVPDPGGVSKEEDGPELDEVAVEQEQPLPPVPPPKSSASAPARPKLASAPTKVDTPALTLPAEIKPPLPPPVSFSSPKAAAPATTNGVVVSPPILWILSALVFGMVFVAFVTGLLLGRLWGGYSAHSDPQHAQQRANPTP